MVLWVVSYDPEKHVWIIGGRDAGKLFDRPTDIAWLPDQAAVR